MTPIQRSLQRAVEIARTLQGEGELTVVLVSDGKETCDPDPCGTVRQLKASGAKFVAHVIGFDVGADEREQLACIAEAAGGKYYSAANAADLMFATQAATSTLVEAPASGEGRVWIDSPATATAGGTITAHFEAAKTFHANAWIGVVPSDIPHGSEETNDAHDLSYEYIRGRTTGTATLPAPSTEGKYDIRLHDSDQDGREVASASFTVTRAGARVSLDGTSFPTGTPLVIHFEASSQLGPNAWIGIIPSDVEHGSADTNDSNDVTYAWVRGEARGSVTLTAPDETGSWDARLNDADSGGAELASVTFRVE